MAEKNILEQKLISYIQDAYAMENEIAHVLQQQINALGEQPEVVAKLTQHLAETELQRKRMQLRLEAYGHSPSVIKGTASTILGNVVGLTGAIRPDRLSRALRDDYVTEHLEIAAYTLLIASAEACGDEETVRQAELSLKEEIAMSQWLFAHLPTVAYTDLQAQGAVIPAQFLEEAKAGPPLRVTFEPVSHVAHARNVTKLD